MLNKNIINEVNKNYVTTKEYQVRRRLFNKVPLVDLVTDEDTSLNQEFDILIPTHGIIDQKHSGRCWSFAVLNILREKVIEKCNLENFELSGSFIAFNDKVERYNLLLEKIIEYKDKHKDSYDRDMENLLASGFYDEGYYINFAQLVNKYGIVPNNIYNENFHSSNTYEVNQILSRLLRKFYLESDCKSLKDKYFKDGYKILISIYGRPLDKFDFEYTDKDNKYHIDKNITPQEFFHKYIGLDLINDYIEISSFKDKLYDYNNVYEFEETAFMSGEENSRVLNLNKEKFKEYLLKELKSGFPVYFYASTTFKKIDGIWTDLLDKYGDLFDVDLTLDNNSIIETLGITGAHTMIIVGYNTISHKWKIENSWGEEMGKNGYYTADDDWIDKYVYKIIIHKNTLDQEDSKLLSNKQILISKWNARI